MNKIIIVCGATASGKSSFAVEIAKKLESEIISCDSMQIYKKMDIGTAKITDKEMCGIKHHMIDIKDPFDEYSVSEYVKDAEIIFAKLFNQGKIPIVVGGTGLYIDGLIYPMTFCSGKNEEVRAKIANEYEKLGAEFMHNKLKEIDSAEAEKIHPNNAKRLIRALEIYETSGKIKNDLKEKKGEMKYNVLMFFLNPSREILYKRINLRVEQMFENGLSAEVGKLLENGVNFEAQSMQAIGYKEFRSFYEKTISLVEVKEQIAINSRHYAKRQICWFKRYEFAKIVNSESCEQINFAIKEAVDFAEKT